MQNVHIHIYTYIGICISTYAHTHAHEYTYIYIYISATALSAFGVTRLVKFAFRFWPSDCISGFLFNRPHPDQDGQTFCDFVPPSGRL